MVNLVSENNFASICEKEVIPYINARKTDGFFVGYKGAKLCYASYKADSERGAVVIVHGLGEGMPKYSELIYYLLLDGLSVYIYDQFSHGKSTRAVSDDALVHVNDFNQFVFDLEIFINSVVTNVNVPIYLFGHSMGGAVTTAYLQRVKDSKISKAFLSSPMLEIKSPKIPKFVIGSILWVASTLAPKRKLFYVKRHPNYKPFESSSYTSLARYNNYENFRQNSKYYRTCTATNKWGYSAFKCTKNLNTYKNIKKINVPIFIATAEYDTLVNNSAHTYFCSLNKNATNKIYYGAKHEIFNSTNNVFSEYLQDLLNYFK